MKIFLTIVLCLLSLDVFANDDLIRNYYKENEICRGSSGDESDKACNKREIVAEELTKNGYCVTGDYGYQKKWEKCKNKKIAKISETKQEKYNRCLYIGVVFQLAVQNRDSGQPPQGALNHVLPIKEVSLEIKKNIINKVYFDKKFRSAIGSVNERMAITNLCANDWKEEQKFKPLK